MAEDLQGYHPELVRRGIYRGCNLAALVERYWRLEAMRVDAGCSAPLVRWRAYSRSHTTAWGVAYSAMREITFRMSPARHLVTLAEGAPQVDAAIERAAEVLLHEVVHCACPLSEGHGLLFCRRLIACAREAYGLDLDTAALLQLPARQGCRAYAIDDAITIAMAAAGVGARLRADPAVRFDPPPPEQLAEERAATASARVLARAAHARDMLAQWERKQQAARRLAAKWRRRVRYYERREAAAAKAKGPAGG